MGCRSKSLNPYSLITQKREKLELFTSEMKWDEEEEEDKEMEEFYRQMAQEESRAKAAHNEGEEGYESSSDEEDDDWYEYPNGNPNDRKRYFVFENDRTLDPRYNMVNTYEEIKVEIKSYISVRLQRMEIEEEERVGLPGFEPLPTKNHYDSSFSDDEEADVSVFASQRRNYYNLF